jgi:hypothetical protein
VGDARLLTRKTLRKRKGTIMRRHDKQDATAAPPVPQKPDAATLVISWMGIIGAAGASVTFNIYHDSHWLAIALAIIAGFLPPYLATILAHIAVGFRALFWKIAVFAVTAGAMAISAIGTSDVLAPGLTIWGGIGFSFVMDSASLLCLWGLISYYEARAACSTWRAARDAGTTGPAQNQAAAGRGQAVPEPGARTAATEAAPVPAPVPGTKTASAEPAAGTSVAATAEPSAEPAVPARRNAVAKTAGVAGEGREERDAVVAEIARRPRPVLEDTRAQQQRALDILAEFAGRTGRRMNNAEFGKALGISKQDACRVRQAVADREAA